VTKYVGLLTQV